VLIAPTAIALRKLLIKCDEYARDYSISLNAVKSKCLVVVPCRRHALFEELHKCVFYIGNKPNEFVNSFCHLVHLINSELNDDEGITKGRNNFIGQVNNTLSYSRSLDSIVQHTLFQSYCTSYYGCELWLLNNPKLEDLCVAYSLRMHVLDRYTIFPFVILCVYFCLIVVFSFCTSSTYAYDLYNKIKINK